MALGGTKEGIPYQKSLQIARDTLSSAIALQKEDGGNPVALMTAVCSAGGTTIEGIDALAKNGFDHALPHCGLKSGRHFFVAAVEQVIEFLFREGGEQADVFLRCLFIQQSDLHRRHLGENLIALGLGVRCAVHVDGDKQRAGFAGKLGGVCDPATFIQRNEGIVVPCGDDIPVRMADVQEGDRALGDV